MAQSAASTQHIKIAPGKTFWHPLINRIERIHQAIAEGIGIDVKGRMDEMGDIGPKVTIIIAQTDRWPETFGLCLQPDIAKALGG